MGFSLNKVQLIGNLGQDAEHRFSTNNTKITSFTLATTESYKDKSGNWVNNTTWHNVTAFGLSDYYDDKLKKGAKLYVEGKLNKEEYTDKDGIKRYAVKVIADKYNGLIPLSDVEPSSTQPDNKTETPASSDNDLPF